MGSRTDAVELFEAVVTLGCDADLRADTFESTDGRSEVDCQVRVRPRRNLPLDSEHFRGLLALGAERGLELRFDGEVLYFE